MPHHAVVLSVPVRTAIGTCGSTLKGTATTELGATPVRAVLARTKLDHAKLETIRDDPIKKTTALLRRVFASK